jgi:hypothetical protein
VVAVVVTALLGWEFVDGDVSVDEEDVDVEDAIFQ